MANAGVSSAVAAQVAGISLPSVNQLASSGILLPATTTFGRGTSRRYSDGDVVALRFLAVTRPFGVSPALVRPVIQQLQSMELDVNKPTGQLIVMNGAGEVKVLEADKFDVAELTKNPVCIVVGLDRLVEDCAILRLETRMRSRGRPPQKKLEPVAEKVTYEREDRNGGAKVKKKPNAKGGLK